MKYELPNVNLNGTSKEALIEQQRAVLKAANTLLAAMAEALPHGRDYQCAEPGAYQIAREQHIEQTKNVCAVIDRCNHILYHLLNLE